MRRDWPRREEREEPTRSRAQNDRARPYSKHQPNHDFRLSILGRAPQMHPAQLLKNRAQPRDESSSSLAESEELFELKSKVDRLPVGTSRCDVPTNAPPYINISRLFLCALCPPRASSGVCRSHRRQSPTLCHFFR